jgi:hypothetical protein
MERLPDSLLAIPKVASVLRRNSHTDGACFRGNEQKFFTYRSRQRSGFPSDINSPTWSYPLALELVLHSAIVTDFAMERLPDSLLAVPKVASVLRRNSHTDEACFPGNEQKFFTYRSHQRSGSPSDMNSPTWSYPLAGSSLRICDRLCHGMPT